MKDDYPQNRWNKNATLTVEFSLTYLAIRFGWWSSIKTQPKLPNDSAWEFFIAGLVLLDGKVELPDGSA